MEIHDLQKGTQEWHAFRMNHYGASEAAAMLGLSKYTTRAELIQQKATGIAPEHDAATEARFADGHRTEAIAREIIAKRLGQQLYPVTCSRGEYSASCDGLTMDEQIAFEHKLWNAALATAVAEGHLPEGYMPQCQQILYVTGAEKVVFTVSDGTEENMVTLDVLPDDAWFEKLERGWEQFSIDVENYQHIETAQDVAGRAPDQLPALRIEVTGMVTASNLAEFKAHSLAVFAGIKTELQTDEDFANADKTTKWCKDVEDRLDAAKQHALSQTTSIDELFRTIDSIKEEARQKRLTLEKLVKTRKDSIRIEMVQAGNSRYAEHVAGLQSEIPGIRLNLLLTAPDFGGSIKGLKTIDSLRNAIDTALANGKIEADAVAKDVRDKLAWCKEHAAGSHALFPDLQNLIGMDSQAFEAVIKSRIHDHEAAEAAKLEAQRQQIRAEEEARASAGAEAKLRAEQEAAAVEERRKQAQLDAQAKPGAASNIVKTWPFPLPAEAKTEAAPLPPATPTRQQLISGLAEYFGVAEVVALEWLRNEFEVVAA